MRQVLLLCDANSDYQTARLAGALARDIGGEFAVERVTIGRGGDWSSVAAGVLRMRMRNTPDVIHAWGAASLAVAALGSRGRIVYSPIDFPARRAISWLRAVMAYRDVHVVATTATMLRKFVSRGIAGERCHLIRPGVEFGRIKRRKNPELRAALGFQENDFVLLAAGESTRAAAHDRAVWSSGILNVLDRRYKLLLWGRGPDARRLARFAASLDQAEMIRVAEQKLGRAVDFDELLGAADSVMVTASGPVPTLPIAIAMAGGLPIVSTVTYTVSELLEDRHTALMVKKATPKLLARRVLDVREDTSLQWSISDMARTEAFEYFAMTRFMQQWRSVYQQACDGSHVEIPQQTAGAGLRFHGRG